MKKSTKEWQSFYDVNYDNQNFNLERKTREKTGKKRWWIKRVSISQAEIYNHWKCEKDEGKDATVCEFYMSCLVLSEAERTHRNLLKRITTPNSRNIKLTTVSVRKYLWEALISIAIEIEFPYSKYPDMSMKDKRRAVTSRAKKFENAYQDNPERVKEYVENPEQTEKKYGKLYKDQKTKHEELKEQLDDLQDNMFEGVREVLGFPAINPKVLTYKVTDDVIAAANGEDCIEYLKTRCSSHTYIFQADFEKICTTLVQ